MQRLNVSKCWRGTGYIHGDAMYMASDCSEVSNARAVRWWDWLDCLALWNNGLNEGLGRVMDGVVGRSQATVDECSTNDSVRRLLRGENVEPV